MDSVPVTPASSTSYIKKQFGPPPTLRLIHIVPECPMVQAVVVQVDGPAEMHMCNTFFHRKNPSSVSFHTTISPVMRVFKYHENTVISKNNAGWDRKCIVVGANGKMKSKEEILQWGESVLIPALRRLRVIPEPAFPILDKQASYSQVTHWEDVLGVDQSLYTFSSYYVPTTSNLIDFLKNSPERVYSVFTRGSVTINEMTDNALGKDELDPVDFKRLTDHYMKEANSQKVEVDKEVASGSMGVGYVNQPLPSNKGTLTVHPNKTAALATAPASVPSPSTTDSAALTQSIGVSSDYIPVVDDKGIIIKYIARAPVTGQTEPSDTNNDPVDTPVAPGVPEIPTAEKPDDSNTGKPDDSKADVANHDSITSATSPDSSLEDGTGTPKHAVSSGDNKKAHSSEGKDTPKSTLSSSADDKKELDSSDDVNKTSALDREPSSPPEIHNTVSSESSSHVPGKHGKTSTPVDEDGQAPSKKQKVTADV